MDNISDLLFKFKAHLAVLNRSPATIETYTDHVRGFLDTLDGGDIRKVTSEVLEDYITGLYDYRTKENKPYRINTIILKVRSIKRFFEFLEKANIIFINPAESIKEPQKERRLPRAILTDKEVRLYSINQTWAHSWASETGRSWRSFTLQASDWMSSALSPSMMRTFKGICFGSARERGTKTG